MLGYVKSNLPVRETSYQLAELLEAVSSVSASCCQEM